MNTPMGEHELNAHHEKLIRRLNTAVADSSSLPSVEVIAVISNFIGRYIGHSAITNEAVQIGIDIVEINLRFGIKEAIYVKETVHGNA